MISHEFPKWGGQRLFIRKTPTYYLFLPIRGVWTRRAVRRNAISRLYFVSPRDQERFFLCLLLLHVRGATSSEDLRTINDTVHPIFWEAAIALRLTESDDEWFFSMNQASLFSMPRSLRSLFVTTCLFCSPSNCLRLFNNFLEPMTEDFLRITQKMSQETCAFSTSMSSW